MRLLNARGMTHSQEVGAGNPLPNLLPAWHIPISHGGPSREALKILNYVKIQWSFTSVLYYAVNCES